MDVCNVFNPVSQLTIFQKLRSSLVFWISSSHLFDDSMHAHPHCIFPRLPDMGIS